MNPIVVTDIETTGLDPTFHEIIDIGAVIVDPETLKNGDSITIRVAPEHVARLSESARIVNGYNAEAWQHAISLKEALEEYSRFAAGCMFCAHNVTFDWGFIDEGFRKTKVLNKLDYHRLDLHTMAWMKLRNKLDHFNLKHVAAYFNLEPEPEPHVGLAGASLECDVLRRLLDTK